MGHKPRLDPIDTIHHVTNHAIGDADFFQTVDDRLHFLKRLANSLERFEIEVIAYCLMGNHFHLVIWCVHGRLSRFMQHLQACYARPFNEHNTGTGAVVRRRFRNVIVESDTQLLNTTRYVHRNPLELGYDIATYPWSSYPNYLGVGGPCSELVPINSAAVLDLAGGQAMHREFVQRDVASDKFRFADGTKKLIIADNVPESEKLLARLLQVAATLSSQTVEDVLAGRRGKSSNARSAIVLIALSNLRLPAQEVGAHLGFATASSLRSAKRRAQHRYDTNGSFRSFVEDIRRRALATPDAIAS